MAASDHGYPRNSVFVTLGKRAFGKGTCTLRTLRGNYRCTMMSRGRCTTSKRPHVLLMSSYLGTLRRLTGCRQRGVNAQVVNVAKAGKGAAAGRLVTSILRGECRILCARNGLGGRVNIPLALLELAPRRRLTIVRVKTGRPNRVGTLAHVMRPSCNVVAGINGTRLRNFKSFRKIVGAGNRLCRRLHCGNGRVVFVSGSGRCLATVSRNLAHVYCNVRKKRKLCVDNGLNTYTPFLSFR